MNGYRRWIKQRLRERRHEYPAVAEPGLFSLMTPVYDTPPRFLRALARSVFRQDYPWFEWVLVDNGSTLPGTRRCLAELTLDPRVRLSRIEPNRGIMGGTRAAVSEAMGQYVLPVDSDDLLSSDALRVMASVLQQRGYPALAYSDEDKLLPNGRRDHPFLKPDWDPVLFYNCCYVAHLCGINRALAIELGAYADEAARGCHDWDTFWRFVRAGHTPVHVPEVLYSWRMHAGSTATPNAAPKPYTLHSQEHVLQGQLCALGLEDRVEMRTNPLFRSRGMWQAARRHVEPAPLLVALHASQRGRCRRFLHALAECSYPLPNVHVFGTAAADAVDLEFWNHLPGQSGMTVTSHGDLQDLWRWLAAQPASALVARCCDTVMPLTHDWPWEALGLFELHEDAVVVGGRLFDEAGRIESAGEIFGVGGLLGTPDWHRHDGEMGHYGLHICQRSVDAVSGEFFIARAGFLLEALAELRTRTPELLSAQLGAMARRRGKRVIYTPHIAAQRAASSGHERVSGHPRDLVEAFGTLRFDDRYYSRHYSRDPKFGYHLASRPFATDHLRPSLVG